MDHWYQRIQEIDIVLEDDLEYLSTTYFLEFVDEVEVSCIFASNRARTRGIISRSSNPKAHCLLV